MINLNRSRLDSQDAHILNYSSSHNPTSSYNQSYVGSSGGHNYHHHHVGLNSSGHGTQVEPMHHSPISTSPTDRVSYLPAYLMGDPGKSPKGKLRKDAGMTPNLDLSSVGAGGGGLGTGSSAGPSGSGQVSPTSPGMTPMNLFSSSGSTGMGSSANAGHVQTPKTKSFGPPRHGLGSTTGSVSITSPTSDTSHGNWVTIFGFQPASQSLILQTFATVGSIIEYKSIPGCNWINVRYSSTIEARKALAKNGCIIGNNIMIGVIKFEPQQANASSLEESLSRSTRIRPLANDNLVNQLPTRETGLMSKVTEFFGW